MSTMAYLYARENKALDVNPPAGQAHLTTHGSDWLWAVTAIYIVSFLAFFGLTFVARAGEKIFHYLFTIALLVGSIAYFAMASDLAWVVVATQTNRSHGLTRQIFFAKYVNWVVAFPVMNIVLGLVTGASWATILYHITLSWTWILAYLFSAFTSSSYKWGFFAFGTVAWLVLAVSTWLEGHRGATRLGLQRDHSALAGWLNFLWMLYPIAFGLSDGGNKISVTGGFVFFGILDVLMIPLLAFATIFLSRRWDYNRMNIAFTQYGRVNAPAGTYPEKHHHGPVGGPTGAPATGGVTGPAAV